MFIQEIIYLIKDGAYVINLDDYKSIRNHWIACMLMVIMVAHLPMQHTLIALDLNKFQKKLKN